VVVKASGQAGVLDMQLTKLVWYALLAIVLIIVINGLMRMFGLPLSHADALQRWLDWSSSTDYWRRERWNGRVGGVPPWPLLGKKLGAPWVHRMAVLPQAGWTPRARPFHPAAAGNNASEERQNTARLMWNTRRIVPSAQDSSAP